MNMRLSLVSCSGMVLDVVFMNWGRIVMKNMIDFGFVILMIKFLLSRCGVEWGVLVVIGVVMWCWC